MALELPKQDSMAETGRLGSSWHDHTPVVWSWASPLTSLRIGSIPWEMKTMICFMVKMKQDSSRHIVGNFPSWYKEELTAGSARIFCTEITKHGSWHKVGAHQHLWVSCLVDWVPLRKSLKGFKQRKNMMGFKILRTSLYLCFGEKWVGGQAWEQEVHFVALLHDRDHVDRRSGFSGRTGSWASGRAGDWDVQN